MVIGAGFGGLNVAARLAGRRGVDLTVMDAQGHHLFQPLLYQVATAALSPRDIAEAIGTIIPEGPGTRVLRGTVTGIDVAARRVAWTGGHVPYDRLVIATGSKPGYFGHDEWAKDAPGLKTMDDALGLRGRILQAFEAAAAAGPGHRAALLRFVLIGGGPNGVEMAGSIAGTRPRTCMRRNYAAARRPRPHRGRGGGRGPGILSEFAPNLSDYSRGRRWSQLGVEVRTWLQGRGPEARCGRGRGRPPGR